MVTIRKWDLHNLFYFTLFSSKICLLGCSPLILNQGALVQFPSEAAPCCQSCIPSHGLMGQWSSQHTNCSPCVARDGGDFTASHVLHIHAAGIGSTPGASSCCPLSPSEEGWRRVLERDMLSWRGHRPMGRLDLTYTFHFLGILPTVSARSTDKSSHLSLWSWTIKGDLF